MPEFVMQGTVAGVNISVRKKNVTFLHQTNQWLW